MLMGPVCRAELLRVAGTALALSRRIVFHFDRWLDRPPLDGSTIIRSRPDPATPE